MTTSAIEYGQQRKPFLVILDLNGTLLYSSPKRLPGTRYDAQARKKFLYFRPGLATFLQWLHSVAEVGVWTSAIRPNADAIVDAVWSACNVPAPLFVKSREQCELIPGPGYRSIKDLQCIWREYTDYGPHNTIILDDTDEKVQRQPENLCLVPEYNLETDSHTIDHALLQILKPKLEEKLRMHTLILPA